jgi:transposase
VKLSVKRQTDTGEEHTYDISRDLLEAQIRGGSADERRAVRQEKSRPIADEFEPWLRAKLSLISQKTKLAEAIRYAVSRWDGLTRFIADGRIEIVQRRRARYPPNRAQPQERPVRRLGRRRRTLGRHRLTDRNLQAHRRRTPRLSRRRHHPHRQRPPEQQIDELLPWAYLATQERWRVA